VPSSSSAIGNWVPGARRALIGNFEVAVSNPLDEKITIELQLPDHLVKLEIDKEEDRIRIKVSRLEIAS